MQTQSQSSRLTGFPRVEYVARFPRTAILARVGTRIYDSKRPRQIGRETLGVLSKGHWKIGAAVLHRYFNIDRSCNQLKLESFGHSKVGSRRRDSLSLGVTASEPAAIGKSENRDTECPTVRFRIVTSHHVTARRRDVARGDPSESIKSSRIAARNWADCGNYRRFAVRRSLFRSPMIYGVTGFSRGFAARYGSANRISYIHMHAR